MRIFLTGASGFVGRHLTAALLHDKQQVVGLAHRARQGDDDVAWVAGDISDEASLFEGMAGCDAVIHLVAIRREKKGVTFEQVHVAGTDNVLKAMRRRGISRLVHMSALGAGPKQPTPYYRTKWAAEELVRASGFDYTIFRPSIIFGPGDGVISLLARQFRQLPVVPVIGDGRYRLALVSIHTVCAAFAQAVRGVEGAQAKTFELCGPEALTYNEILQLLSAYLHIRRLRLHLPVGLVTFGIRLLRSLGIPSPITMDEMTMLLLGSVCTENTAYDTFDLPHITLAEGMKEYLVGRKVGKS